MEFVDCLVCGSSDRQTKFVGRDRLQHAPGHYTLVECRSCHFLYLSPRPGAQELGLYYPDDYASFRPSLNQERSRIRKYERVYGLRRRARAVLRYKSEGAILDVGCGTGDFLEVMRRNGAWSVRGLEPQQRAATQARTEYRIPIDAASIDEAVYANGSFDVVTLWDVLEHVPNPRKSLQQIFHMLRPDGIVVLGVPNRDSFDAKLFGPAWAGLDFPRHFSVFNARHLRDCLVGAGFGEPSFQNLGGYQSFVLSVRFWLDGTLAPEWLRRLVLAYVGSIPFRLATMPYFAFVRLMHRGATVVAVGRKSIS